MGTNNLATIGASIVRAVGTQLDQYFTAITGVFVPRNSAGVPTDEGAGLGSSTYKWADAHIDNIKIDGNTISSTDTDGDINLTPDGAGKVVVIDIETKNEDFNLDTGTGRTKITRLFGDTGSEQTLTHNTQTTPATVTAQATKDIVIFLNKITTNTGARTITTKVLIDANATPTTLIHEIVFESATPDLSKIRYVGSSFFVKKGHYYTISVQNSGTGTQNVTYRITEIGG